MGSWPQALNDPTSQLTPYLRPGERLLWTGRPDPKAQFSNADVFLVPFSIVWCGFVLFWEGSVLASGGPPFFVLWGIPFVAVGVYFTFGRFIYKRRMKLRTAYGISADRAMVAIGSSSFSDSPIKQVPTSIRRARDGRHVSITFGSQSSWPGFGSYANTGMDFFMRGSAPVAFYDVAEPEALLSAVEQARRS